MCQFNNIHIVCLDNSINTVEGNVQNFGLFAWLYENESANSSRRNKQAKSAKAQRGLFVGSNPPYGYRSENGILKIKNDNTPATVHRIFQDYLSGTGMDTIAKKLTEEAIPTPAKIANKVNASNQWHGSTIKKILSNPHYCGDLVQSRTETIMVTSSKRRELETENQIIIKDTHEAIIPKDTFNTVQDLIQSRTRTATAPKRHLFTNILYCDECQKGMWYKANQKGYRCGGNIRYGQTFCPNRVVIREKELIQVIVEDLRALFNQLKEESFKSTLLKKLNKRKQQILRELDVTQTEIDKLKTKKLNYVDLYMENDITKEELVEYRELTDNNIKSLQYKNTHLKEKLQECEDENYAIHISNKLKDILSLKDLTPQILHSLVEKVTINKDGDVHILYSFVNPLQAT
ncbi:recombinase family protein [Anaerobacillus isosaccharinicus]|uniref:Recombinase family protein n=1 Tax=Anaerobacillus isosaccharinicus TaxID=1532552 RepID=A0A7S7RDE8_9BACI